MATSSECRVSHVRRLKIRVIMRWYWELCTTPSIWFTADENPEKPQLGDSQWRLCDQSSPQVESLPSKWSHSTSGKEKEGKDGVGDKPSQGTSCCPWSHGLGQNSFTLVWRCHQLLSGFLAKGHVTSVASIANDKSDNEMTPGAVHRFSGICLTAEENPGKPQLGEVKVCFCYIFIELLSRRGIPILMKIVEKL